MKHSKRWLFVNLPGHSPAPAVPKAYCLTFSLSLTLSAAGSVHAQGLMEYGGLMAAPKGLPSGNTINSLVSPYSKLNIPTGSGSAAGGGAAQSILPYQTVGADGSISVNPKKVKEIADRAAKAYEGARAKLKLANPTPKDLKDCENLLRETIALRNSVWGYSDPTIPVMLNQLGSVYEKQNQPATAESCYKNALVYITKKSGSGSYDRLDTLTNLARMYEKAGKHKEALDNYSQVAQIKERQDGPNNLKAIAARLDWARSLAALDKPESESVFESTLKSLEATDRSKDAVFSSKLGSELQLSYGAFLTKKGKVEEGKRLSERLSKLSAATTSSTSAAEETAKPPTSPTPEPVKAPELKQP
ncbi:MAG: tetratricopeptide repeat protein [Candidatus Obscuribacter sp.]|nr:tetratricopeptide repeat protein [Candidatus Obscuribacter sp.]